MPRSATSSTRTTPTTRGELPSLGQPRRGHGADAQPESLQAVKEGTQLDTVTHSPFVEAYWAVEAMANILQDGTKPPASKFPEGNVIIPMTVVTQANADKISAWGTPEEIAPLPYGKAQAYRVTSDK